MGLLSRKTTKNLTAAAFVAAAGLLALPGLGNAGDETFNNVKVIPIPNMTSFDISWWDPVSGDYLLADRSNISIDAITYYGYSIGQIHAGFAGVFTNPNGSVNNDFSGPNGVLAFNNPTSGQNEIWVGDGPQANSGCPTFLKTCSSVKVITWQGGSGSGGTPGVVTHTILTNGAARADELCSDPVDHVVMVANDAEYDVPFGTPFVTFISTDNYQITKQVLIPEATNGIEQCKWDRTTGYFFINIPEINGPGNDTADGATYVYDKTGSLIARYFIDIASSHCAGPQGLAVGPEPQLLLGCNAPDKQGLHNSLIIDKHTGATLAIAWGLGGADEVWFNGGDTAGPGDSHYVTTSTKTSPHTLNIFDGTGAGAVDQILAIPTFGTVSPHSVAMDTIDDSVFVPNSGEVDLYTNSGNDSDDVSTPNLSN